MSTSRLENNKDILQDLSGKVESLLMKQSEVDSINFELQSNKANINDFINLKSYVRDDLNYAKNNIELLNIRMRETD